MCMRLYLLDLDKVIECEREVCRVIDRRLKQKKPNKYQEIAILSTKIDILKTLDFRALENGELLKVKIMQIQC